VNCCVIASCPCALPSSFPEKGKGKFVVVFPVVAKEDFTGEVDGKSESEKEEVEESASRIFQVPIR